MRAAADDMAFGYTWNFQIALHMHNNIALRLAFIVLCVCFLCVLYHICSDSIFNFN